MEYRKIRSILKKDPFLEKNSIVKNILFNKYFPNLDYFEYRDSNIWIPIAWQEFNITIKKEKINLKDISKSKNLWGNGDLGPVG